MCIMAMKNHIWCHGSIQEQAHEETIVTQFGYGGGHGQMQTTIAGFNAKVVVLRCASPEAF